MFVHAQENICAYPHILCSYYTKQCSIYIMYRRRKRCLFHLPYIEQSGCCDDEDAAHAKCIITKHSSALYTSK